MPYGKCFDNKSKREKIVFRKYEKTPRLPAPGFPHGTKSYMKGKIVWPDFIKEIYKSNQHWSTKQVRKNKIV
jgi:hypothetical protein